VLVHVADQGPTRRLVCWSYDVIFPGEFMLGNFSFPWKKDRYEKGVANLQMERVMTGNRGGLAVGDRTKQPRPDPDDFRDI
jgi:hypothetical protein